MRKHVCAAVLILLLTSVILADKGIHVPTAVMIKKNYHSFILKSVDKYPYINRQGTHKPARNRVQ